MLAVRMQRFCGPDLRIVAPYGAEGGTFQLALDDETSGRPVAFLASLTDNASTAW